MMGDWAYNDWCHEAQIVKYEIIYTNEWDRECDVEII